MQYHPLVKEVLFDLDQIVVRTKELAEEVSNYYKSQKITDVICLGLLKGCVPFLAEFIKHLKIECSMEYMVTTSFYGGVKAAGAPQIKLDLDCLIVGKNILIVEDIIDSGRTLKMIKEYLYLKGATSVKIVTLLDKNVNRQADIEADWFGFNVGNHFLIGYGLDYNERLRNLPYVAIADEAKIKNWKW